MQNHEAQTKNEFETEIRQKKEQQMRNLAGKLHHLVSTKAINGVYNGVYTRNYKISNVNVDEYLRKTAKVKWLVRDRQIQDSAGANRSIGEKSFDILFLNLAK